MKKSRAIATSLALIISISSVATPAAAAVIGNESLVTNAVRSDSREQVKNYLDREDVLAALQSYGVSPEMAQKRVESMTDQEISKLAENIETAPAGAGVVGVLFSVFVILLVTDILGLTKVFPFTRSVR